MSRTILCILVASSAVNYGSCNKLDDGEAVSFGVRGSEHTHSRNTQGGGGGGGGGSTTCSTNNAPEFATPSVGTCLEDVVIGTAMAYPEDFGGLTSASSIYTCPTSNLRIITSNAIPDHAITPFNPNGLCEIFWMVSIPLTPSFADAVTEPSALGIIGMGVNGIPAFGGQEGGGANAVEPAADGTFDGVPYFGHPGRGGNWHYHSGEFGLFEEVGDVPSDQLLGYAMDGFPIYGPLPDNSVLDECNGIGDTAATYQYHVRRYGEIDETVAYCDGESSAIKWGYIIGCFKGDLSSSSTGDAITLTMPDDCTLETTTVVDGSMPITPTATFSSPTAAPASDGTAVSCTMVGMVVSSLLVMTVI